ncbi:MAG: hypothetical protein AMXMBFR13_44650 [Phycisphaerae bacterium]
MRTGFILLLVLVVFLWAGEAAGQGWLCMQDDECGFREYCAHPSYQCDSPGSCTPIPVQYCFMVWLPVCGCDGRTYSNACVAETSGVSIKAQGECTCTTNADCAGGWYCLHPTGDCTGAGVCRPRGNSCSGVWSPVCGCDGQTYANECHARLAGVSMAYAGECSPPCSSNAECAPAEFCCEQSICLPRPADCDDTAEPVCGSDGATYANACRAHQAGVTVAGEGPCTTVPPDFDRDGDVDQSDFGVLQSCYGVPELAPWPPECAPADLDQDGDVDLDDFGFFQRCISGPDMEPEPGCME